MRTRATAMGLVSVLLVSCGARSGISLPTSDGAAATIDAAPSDASLADGGVTDGPPSEPCLQAPRLAAGTSVSGTTCGAVNPSGSTCSGGRPSVFYRIEIPPRAEVVLGASSHLSVGILCACPETRCCVGPSGSTGDSPGDLVGIANGSSRPITRVLVLSRADSTCGGYMVSLRRFARH